LSILYFLPHFLPVLIVSFALSHRVIFHFLSHLGRQQNHFLTIRPQVMGSGRGIFVVFCRQWGRGNGFAAKNLAPAAIFP
jgi:hypothetical protein